MLAEQIYSSMINLITDAIPSAFITINGNDKIVDLRVSQKSPLNDRLFFGKHFFRLILLVSQKHNCQTLYEAVTQCRIHGEPVAVKQMLHLNFRHECLYFNWNLIRVPGTEYIVAFIQNITESVLIEEEFKDLCEQQDSINQDLCIAMSKLDFQYMDLDQAHRKLNTLYRITSVVQRTVSLPEIFDEIIAGLTQQLGYVNAAIFLLDDDTGKLVIKAHHGYRENIIVEVTEGIIGYCFRNRELAYVPDVTSDTRYIPGTQNGVSEVAIPLIVDEKVIGVLDVETPEGRIIKDYDLDLLRSLGSQIALTIAHARHVSEVQTQAITDSLTGLSNFRYFRSVMDQEFKRAVRYQRPLSMLMIDIDNYKHYNDTHGHRMGDEVLKDVATVLRNSVRDVDLVARYGGEEFAVLCPETFLDEATIIAERIRENIENYPFPNKHTQPGGTLTVSVGVAAYPRDANDADTLIDHADLALYTAKRASKNQVCIYGKTYVR